jgi:hypothetical protein
MDSPRACNTLAELLIAERRGTTLVGVAQLVERWLVEPEVAGASPVVHPNKPVAGHDRQATLSVNGVSLDACFTARPTTRYRIRVGPPRTS